MRDGTAPRPSSQLRPGWGSIRARAPRRATRKRRGRSGRSIRARAPRPGRSAARSLFSLPLKERSGVLLSLSPEGEGRVRGRRWEVLSAGGDSVRGRRVSHRPPCSTPHPNPLPAAQGEGKERRGERKKGPPCTSTRAGRGLPWQLFVQMSSGGAGTAPRPRVCGRGRGIGTAPRSQGVQAWARGGRAWPARARGAPGCAGVGAGSVPPRSSLVSRPRVWASQYRLDAPGLQAHSSPAPGRGGGGG